LLWENTICQKVGFSSMSSLVFIILLSFSILLAGEARDAHAGLTPSRYTFDFSFGHCAIEQDLRLPVSPFAP